jgi:hypothetical protein
MLECALMLIQSLPFSCLLSRLALGMYTLADLPALAIDRLSVLPRLGITVHSASSGLSVSSINTIGRAMGRLGPVTDECSHLRDRATRI